MGRHPEKRFSYGIVVFESAMVYSSSTSWEYWTREYACKISRFAWCSDRAVWHTSEDKSLCLRILGIIPKVLFTCLKGEIETLLFRQALQIQGIISNAEKSESFWTLFMSIYGHGLGASQTDHQAWNAHAETAPRSPNNPTLCGAGYHDMKSYLSKRRRIKRTEEQMEGKKRCKTLLLLEMKFNGRQLCKTSAPHRSAYLTEVHKKVVEGWLLQWWSDIGGSHVQPQEEENGSVSAAKK